MLEEQIQLSKTLRVLLFAEASFLSKICIF